MLCTICKSVELTRAGSVDGYRQGDHYAVFECRGCESSVVDPCRGDERLYEAIYKNVSKVPGYARYHTLADQLLHARDPLNYIAKAEDCYYAIVKSLRDRISRKAETKICEVGCGQGYLTYALVRGGFNCTGVDISANAVALARQRFGDNYFCGDVSDFI